MAALFFVLFILILAITNGLADCITEARAVTVKGISLSGLVELGDTLKILISYYQCNPVRRDDVVAFSYAGSKIPIIKIVKGIEGDKFQLRKAENDCWNVLINGVILRTTRNTPYCLDKHGYRMLSLYEKDCKGIIPKDAYLILGNQPGGSLDSTRFGLVSKKCFLGKIVKNRKYK
jgi:signal peptidase I